VEQNLALEKAVCIEGTLLMLDDVTPHVAVPVQAIRDGESLSTMLSDETGKYRSTNLRPGKYQLRCQILDGYIYYGKDGAGRKWSCEEVNANEAIPSSLGDILEIKPGEILNVDFRFAPFKKGSWRNYGPFDGLAHDTVNRVFVNSDGIMWLGTNSGGISRYDGKQFINFTAKDGLSADVWDIYCDPDGVMWFGTSYGGILRYDGKEFVNFTAGDGLAGNTVHVIYRDPDGVMWFGGWHGEGVSRYDGKKFTNLTAEDGLASNSVQVIQRDSNGMMWFGTDNGASCYDGRQFVKLTAEENLASDDIRAIHLDPNGMMWFGTANGVCCYDGREFIRFTTKDGLVDNSVNIIRRDSDGSMWFATSGGGISRYDGKTFVNFTKEDGLPCNFVKDIHIDQDGVMWIGTGTIMSAPAKRGGLSRYDTKTFINFTTRDGLPNDTVSDIYIAPDGIIWIGTMGGISRYDGDKFVNFTVEDGLISNNVTAVESGIDDALWFGTGAFFRIPPGKGVSRYDSDKFITFTTEDGLVADTITTIYCNSDGAIWFGTYDGISYYDGREFVNYTTADRLADAELSWAGNFVMAICQTPDGMLWFGTYSGVFRYDGKEFINYTQKDGLACNMVNAIWHDVDGILWFGTWGSGVSRYDGKKFTNFSTEDGLAENTVHSILRDSDGILWFGLDSKGIAGYDGIAWTSLDTRDGLAGNTVNSIRQDSEGFLWFGTNGGLTRYRRNMTSPKAYIASVTTDRSYDDLSDIPAFTPGIRITIGYSSVDFKTLPEKRQYRCRIYKSGGNKHISPYLPATKNTTFDWTPKQLGTYVFEVQAIDRDLYYSEPARISLTIQPDPKIVSMQAELSYLRSEVGRKYQFDSIIGGSHGIRLVRALMEKAIDSGLTVLIIGETGTGKELVAKAIHYNSPRKDGPLLDRNCGAMPRELLASDLFGHRRGAFTGANEDRMGLFEASSGGTLLLDEIGEMPEDAQLHLLRVLEEHKVQRLGEHKSRDVDARIIAMTNRDLVEEVTAGRFRRDLYHRFNEFPIHIPPLRERIEDIPLLAEHFLQEYSEGRKKELGNFAPDVFDVLRSYAWPGNVRELRNAVRRAAALAAEGDQIQIYHFSSEITQERFIIQRSLAEGVGLSAIMEQFQRRVVEDVLQECNGNRAQAARVLGIHRPNLIRIMKRLGIE